MADRIDFGELGRGEVQTSSEVVEGVVVGHESDPTFYEAVPLQDGQYDQYGDRYTEQTDPDTDYWTPGADDDDPVMRVVTTDVITRSGKLISTSQVSTSPGEPGHQEAVGRVLDRAGLAPRVAPGATEDDQAPAKGSTKANGKKGRSTKTTTTNEDGDNSEKAKSGVHTLGTFTGRVALKSLAGVIGFSYMTGSMFIGINTGANLIGQAISFGHLGNSPYSLTTDMGHNAKILVESPIITYKHAGKIISKVVPFV